MAQEDADKKLNKPAGQPPKKRPGFPIYWIYFFLISFLVVTYFFQSNYSVRTISYQEFERNALKKHAVERIVVVNNEEAEIYLKKEFKDDSLFKDVLKPLSGEGVNPGPHYKFNIGSVETFERKLLDAEKDFPEDQKVSVEYVTRGSFLKDILPWLIPIIFLVLIWRYSFRMMSGGGASGSSSIFNFRQSTAKLQEKATKSTVTFDDVAGLEEAKVEIKEIVEFLKEPKAYTRLGAKIPKGVIIVGPPGTGKTLLVKAVAGEANVPFFSISGSEFVEMFVGVGASRVRDLFKKAKEKAPCIVFIDEIDAVGRSRGKNAMYSGSNDERESTLNQLLTELDGFGTNSGIIVLAATNRGDMLDPALLRPGRFDRHIYLELPTVVERKAIFKVHMRPLVMDDTIDVDYLASQTPGSSGADIANICNEAALIAARKRKQKISLADFMDAIDRVIAGLEKRSKIISPEEKKIIAYHEAGHAVVSWMLKHVDPLVKVSIIPRGKSLGAAWYLPEERQLRNTAQFMDMLSASLGGRAAEEIVFGDVTSGALDDLEKVTKQAYAMVMFLGFDKRIGNVSFYDSTGMRDSGIQKPYSEETSRIIDEEVRKLVDTAYERTKKVLLENRDKLSALAELLLKKEMVLKDDIEKILGARPNHKPPTDEIIPETETKD